MVIINAEIRSVLRSGDPALVRRQIDACPVLSPLRPLEQVSLGIPNHTRDILSHSLSVFENAASLSQTMSFTLNTRTLQNYEEFFALNRDAVLFAALVHDVGMGMNMFGPDGILAPVVRYDEISGHLIARGHEKVGAGAAGEMALAAGLSETESEYVSFLVRNHMATGGIKYSFQDPEIIGYHRRINWDMGSPFLALCDQQGLDASDAGKEGVLRSLIDYQFSFHFPFCLANMSMLQKLEGVPKRHKQIYVPIQSDDNAFRGLLSMDHTAFLRAKMALLERQAEELCVDEVDELFDNSRQMDALLGEINDTGSIERRIERAMLRVSLCNFGRSLSAIEDAYFRDYREQLPVVVI